MEGSDLSTFITSITGAMSDFTVANLGVVLVAALGLTAGLFLAWFAYRYIKRKVAAGITKGRI